MQLETVGDYVNFFRKTRVKVKMVVDLGVVHFRFRPSESVIFWEDFLDTYRPAGVIFYVKNNLRWHECFFNKVQVDERPILLHNPRFDALRRYTEK
jgi:hypothetical protein